MGKPLLWGLVNGLVYFIGLGSFSGLASRPMSLIFQNPIRTHYMDIFGRYWPKSSTIIIIIIIIIILSYHEIS